MKNSEIREKAKAAGIPLWKIADVLGITDSTFSRWLRRELPAEKTAECLKAIEMLSN